MAGDRGGYVIKVDGLPSSENASTFASHEHGALVSFFLSHNWPGTGPKLHQHPYEETFVVEEGDALFTVGERTIEATGGTSLSSRPGFHTSSSAARRRIARSGIHPVARMEAEWLE